MQIRLILTALGSSLLTLVAVEALPGPISKRLFQNARVRVTEFTYAPGVPRPRYTRPTDQVIVFLDDCRYERINSLTHQKSIQVRKSGDVIWHNKGDDAPVLTNLSSKPYRTVLIELP